MADGMNKPAIRFAGFTDAWEQRKAKELCSIGTGKSNTQDQVDDGKYPFYIRSDIPVKSNKYLYDCEAVITIGDGNIGKVFHYVNGKFDLHQRCYKMTDFQDIWGKYFFYYFSTKFYDRAMKMTAKATVDSVRLEMISEMDIKKPPQISEQKQIAEFFTSLDNLITLHQREYAKLVNIKASMLEKMFPKDGSAYPEVRFAGFTDAWEQRKFEDLYDYASEGGTPDTNNPAFYEGGKIPFVKIEDTVEKYIDSPKSYITEEGMNHSSAWLIPKGNVIFTNGATVGNVAINRLPVTTKQGILGIIPSKKVTSEFLFYLLSSTEFQREVRSRMATGTFATIILKSLNEIPVCFPSNTNEQESIITILSKLDNLITLHQRKLEKLQNIKKSMLEKMFV